MKLLMILFILTALFLASWIGWTLYEAQIEEPTYTIVKKTNEYEIRTYQPYLIATTQTTGPYKQSQYDAFYILADYIFGNNTDKTKMAMTAPVIGQKLADSLNQMIISTQTNADRYNVSFVMPQKFTMETLPKPVNPAVTLEKVPEHMVAVKRFSGYITHEKIKAKTLELVRALEKDGYTIKGLPRIARYNPPFAFPLLMRNEIFVQIEQ